LVLTGYAYASECPTFVDDFQDFGIRITFGSDCQSCLRTSSLLLFILLLTEVYIIIPDLLAVIFGRRSAIQTAQNLTPISKLPAGALVHAGWIIEPDACRTILESTFSGFALRSVHGTQPGSSRLRPLR
jgi:hypothetical protein